MLYILPETTGDIIVLQGADQVSIADIENIALTEIEKVRAKQAELRVLLYLDPSFTGFSLTDPSQTTQNSQTPQQPIDTKTLLNILEQPNRLAIVAEEHWHDPDLHSEVIQGVQYFMHNQFLQGLHWLNEDENEASLYPFSP